MTMNRFTFFIPVLCFLLLGGLLWRGLYLDSRTLPSMLIDKAMPEFSLRTVRGEPVTNGDLPNEIFLLNVWGSYCLPCLVEHPTFMRLTEEGQIKALWVVMTFACKAGPGHSDWSRHAPWVLFPGPSDCPPVHGPGPWSLDPDIIKSHEHV